MSSSKIESLVKELRLELMKEVRLELMKEGVNLCGLGVVEKRGRGRPRKEKSCGLGVVEKRGRGRPRKEKVSSVSGGEELIASLIRNGEEKKSEYGKRLLEDDVLEEELEDEKMLEKRLERDEKKVLEKELEEDDVLEEEELEVTKFIVNGKTYLKSEEDILYDIESHDAVGIWNEEEKEIKEIPDDDE